MPSRGDRSIDAANGFAYPALEAPHAVIVDATRRQGVGVSRSTFPSHCTARPKPSGGGTGQARPRRPFLSQHALGDRPCGGVRGLLRTNPIALGCPLPDSPPIVVDLSLAKVVRYSILAAKQRGDSIPEGWALDAAGRADKGFRTGALKGTMLPVGDAKGNASSHSWLRILAAGLTSANYANSASALLDAQGPPPCTGQLIIALDPAVFGGEAMGPPQSRVSLSPAFPVPGAASHSVPEAEVEGVAKRARRCSPNWRLFERCVWQTGAAAYNSDK